MMFWYAVRIENPRVDQAKGSERTHKPNAVKAIIKTSIGSRLIAARRANPNCQPKHRQCLEMRDPESYDVSYQDQADLRMALPWFHVQQK
jgi:hypothetical protein